MDADFGRVCPMGVTESGSEPIIDKSFGDLTAREVHDIARLRSDVFVVEQSCVYPDLDGRDTEPTTRHLWIAGDDDPIAAYARCLSDESSTFRIGRVVTAPAQRGKGHAGRIVAYLLGRLDGEIILDAQTYLREWYAKLGFVPSGDEFIEDGIAHIPMRYGPDR